MRREMNGGEAIVASLNEAGITTTLGIVGSSIIEVFDLLPKAGLRYIYAGNLPGRVGDLENTRCGNCGGLLVRRYGYFVEEYRVTASGSCRDCGRVVPGRWAEKFEGQIADRPFVPGRLVEIG